MNFTQPSQDAGERVCNGIGSPLLTPRRLRIIARCIAAAAALYVVLGDFLRP